MGSDRSRVWRGWVYAVLVAVLLSLAFSYAEQFSRRRGSSFFLTERTTKHTAISTTFKPDFATEEAPLIFQEALDIDESKGWSDYRSQPSSTLVATLEPTVRAQLMAPQMAESIQSVEASEIAQVESWTQHQDSQMRMTSARIEKSEPTTYVSTKANNASGFSFDGWPRPDSLLREIETLNAAATAANDDLVQGWTQQVSQLLEDLASTQSMKDPRCVEVFQKMKGLAEPILRQGGRQSNPNAELNKMEYKVAYAIIRRTMIWQSISNCMRKGTEETPEKFVSLNSKQQVDFNRLGKDLLEMRQALQSTGDVPGWTNYLLLDSLDRLAQSSELSAEATTHAARMFLSRVTWQRVTDSQRAMLAHESVQRVAKNLHPLAYGPIDYRQLAADLEAIEANATHRCRASVAQQVMALRFASNPSQMELAEQINTFYRNANLRLAVSQELLQRCLPKEQIVERPVHSRILGADTRGASQVNTQLAIDLVPDKQAWNIDLKLRGDMMTNTRSSKGPATFYNNSNALIDTTRRIRVDVQGLKITGENASVASQDRLKGFDTDFDSLPLLGDMLRVVVRQQFDSERGIAQRIVRRTIAEQADSEFDRTLASKMSSAEKQLNGTVLRPLAKMELNPLVVDLETTEKRLIARYRIAGSGQMAAHTPRPLAPSDSQMSVQIHESAINNAIDKIGLPGRPWTLPELGQQLASVLDQPAWEVSPDTPTDLTIHFADSRPLTVEFVDGKMELTLRIMDMFQPGNIDLHDFVIRTSYEIASNGMKADLVHIGPISVDSQRDRLKLRTVFARVFAARQTIPLIYDQLASDERVKGLAISQAKIQDGWMALAISPENSPHVAQIRSLQPTVIR